jgi:hypothetical protein
MFYVSFYLEKEGAAVPTSGIISLIKKKGLDNEQLLKLWKTTIDIYQGG